MLLVIYVTALAILLLFLGVFGQHRTLMPLAFVGLLGGLVLNFTTDEILFAGFSSMLDFSGEVARVFSGLAIATTALIILLTGYAFRHDPTNAGDKYGLLLFSLAGALILFGYQHLVMLFLGIEILSIPLYVLAGSNKSNRVSNEAAMKYFLMGAFASALLLFGIAFIYGATGTFSLGALSAYQGMQAEVGALPGLYYTGMVLMILGMLFKIGAAPLHFWTPDVYTGAPTVVTAFMATVVKTASVVAFFKLLVVCFGFGEAERAWVFPLTIAAALTMSVGNITAIYQQDFKRTLAYSSISHAGYLLLALVSLGHAGAYSAILMYATAYSIASVAAFAGVVAVQESTGRTDFRSFQGLGRTQPLLAVSLTLAVLSLAGIPLTAGFFGKYYMFTLAIEQHLWLVLVAVVNSAISVYYYFRVIAAMYFVKSVDAPSLDVPIAVQTAMAVAAVAILVLGIYPEPVVGWLGL